MPSTKALRKQDKRVSIQEVHLSEMLAPGEVRVQIKLGGLCRTDLYVAQGKLQTPDPLILGHECAGVVRALGAGVRGLELGQAVTIDPWLGCGLCPLCLLQRSDLCQDAQMIGLHLDGAFCDTIILPSTALYSVSGLSWMQAAFVEPVASCLGVLNAPLYPQTHGVIIGEGRIAQLTQKIMLAHGFFDVQTLTIEEAKEVKARCFDFVIETLATEESLSQIIRLLKPKGKLVLKSRPPAPVPLDIWALTRKELQLHAVHYGSFEAAISMLRSGSLVIDDLFGERWPLSRFQEAFDAASHKEAKKQFLLLDETA
jgi:threonine dehydrogenase-like Zn-dependent dehydrogenase